MKLPGQSVLWHVLQVRGFRVFAVTVDSSDPSTDLFFPRGPGGARSM